MMANTRYISVLLTALLLGCAAAQDSEVVTRLGAWADLEGVLHVRWVTAPEHPSKGWVQYGASPALGRRADEDSDALRGTTNNRDAGTGWACNHRADISAIQRWPVHLKVAGATREGLGFESAVVVVQGPVQPTGRARRASVPIRIHPGDWRLRRLPITVGVPFPKGELANPADVQILIDGRPTTAQFQVVTRWRDDNTVKWLRVDFLAPEGVQQATLEYGSDVPSRDYGPDRVPFGMSAAPLPFLPMLVSADGTRYEGLLEDQTLEEVGPVKSVLRLRGHFTSKAGAKLCAWTMRYHDWDSDEVMPVEFTFENDNVDAEFTSIRSLSLIGTQAPAADALVVGLGDEAVSLREGEGVLQREDFEWVKQPGGAQGKRLQGVIAVGSDRYTVLRHLWQQWPASVQFAQGKLTIGLCPALPEGFYADRKDEDKLYYHIRDGLHSFRQGFSKTWELLDVSDGQSAASSLVGEPPVGAVPAQWVEDSGVLGGIAVAVGDGFPGYDEALARGIDRYLATRDRSREYGMMNFGDWYGERRWNWGNLEYDLGHGFLTQFVRSGKPEFFWRAQEALRHQRDVDTRHYAKDPRRIGQQWTHSMGHTAGYYPPEYKDMKVYASPGWSDNRGHVWAQGLFEHYLLGGDRRSFESAKLIADVFAGPGTTNYRFGNAREPGWITKLVMSAYLATEDPYYLNAAKIMLDAVHVKSVATGDHGFYYHKLATGHCNCDEKHSGEAGFMLGVLMTGMKMYYDETGDEQVAQDIVKIANFIVDTMWVPEQMAFRYTSCPKTGASGGSAWIMMQGLAFAARHSSDDKLAQVCRKSLAAAWSYLPTSGKSAGYILCAAPQALQEVAQLPGVSFADYRRRIESAIKSPARRALPANVPNPDFEADILGWPSRGIDTQQAIGVGHSGRAAMKISGTMAGQNEYVNTRYDTHGGPYEITWLEPGATYRLSAWLRVDGISPDTPGPSLRLAFRDATGTRGAGTTGRYDLAKMGTWQQLSTDVQVPEWNTRNYIALNTNTREEVRVEMYFDDISLVPVNQAGADPYTYVRMAAGEAALEGTAAVRPDEEVPNRTWVVGPGGARWTCAVPAAGRYSLWAVLPAGASPGEVRINDEAPAPITAPEEDTWVRLGDATLEAGEVTVELPSLPDGPAVARLVLTDDPSASVK